MNWYWYRKHFRKKNSADCGTGQSTFGCSICTDRGPSSSSKTTFSHRLSVQLRANGLCPYPIAVDNYFKEREETPKDENGNYDFEGLGAVDVELFNRQLQELLDGKEVVIPEFNFVTGHKEYKGRPKKLKEMKCL